MMEFLTKEFTKVGGPCSLKVAQQTSLLILQFPLPRLEYPEKNTKPRERHFQERMGESPLQKPKNVFLFRRTVRLKMTTYSSANLRF